MKLRELKLATVVVPVAFLAGLAYIALFAFPGFFGSAVGFVALLSAAGIAVFFFSRIVFRIIETLEQRVYEQNRQLAALARIAAASAEATELNELLNVALDHVIDITGADAGVICLLDTEAEELVAACYRGLSDEVVKQIRRQKLGDEPIGTEVVRTGRPVAVEDLLKVGEAADMARREGFHSSISVPLRAEGQVGGVLAVATRQRRKFEPNEVELLTNIGGQLGLAVRNAILFSKTRQRNQELGALLAVGRAATASLDLAALLDEALEGVIEVTSADAAEVWLTTDDGALELVRQRGLAETGTDDRARVRLGEGLPGLAAARGSPVITHDLQSEAAFVRDAVRQGGFQTYCLFPLRHRDETLGVLAVAAREKEALSSTSECRLLQGIGEQIAIATENARLHGRVLDLAVIEERERIARELHDGLAQVLGYINTQTLAIRKLLASGRTEEAEQQLRVMEDASREVYADVREAILGLSTSFADPGGLIPNLRAYLVQYSEMAGLPVQLDARANGQSLRLPAMAEIQLMRIIQEALSNCRKHANATAVRVGLEAQDGCLRVEIADDGQGFDAGRPSRSGWPKFGLQSMNERANAIGGTFEVLSQPRRGTTVRVHVPIRRDQEVADARASRR